MASPFAPIPMPKSGMEAFNEGLATSQKIFDSLVNNKKVAAEAKRQEKMAELPFAGVSVPGPAGQIAGLEMVRQVYGENSPQYQQAQKAFALSQNSIDSRIGYQNALRDSMPIRYTTPEGRQIIERSNVHQGYSPAGTPQGEPIAPGQAPYHEPNRPNFATPGQVQPNQAANPQDQILNSIGSQPQPDISNQIPASNNGMPTAEESYALRQTKADLPASVMSKDLYATNIEKTLNNINLDALTQYNGPMGALELKKQQALDAIGKSDEKYQKYKEAEAKFSFLTNQIRQFYGDSIQPTAMAAKEAKLDPRGAWKSVKTAKTSFNSQKDLLRKELQTYRDAAKNPSVYQGTSSLSSQESSGNGEGVIEKTKTINGQQFGLINGEWIHL